MTLQTLTDIFWGHTGPFILSKHLPYTFKTPSLHFPDTLLILSRHLPYTFQTPSWHSPTPSLHCQNTNNPGTPSRHLPNTLQTPSRHPSDTLRTCFRHHPDNFKTTSRHLTHIPRHPSNPLGSLWHDNEWTIGGWLRPPPRKHRTNHKIFGGH